MRGDIGIVAVLGTIGEAKDKTIYLHDFAVAGDLVFLFRITEP